MFALRNTEARSDRCILDRSQTVITSNALPLYMLFLTILHVVYDIFPVVRVCYIIYIYIYICVCVCIYVGFVKFVIHDLTSSPHQRIL